MTWRARIGARCGHPVQRLVLDMPSAFTFAAGQYLQVLHPAGPVPLSIASAPHRLPELHLHYLSTPGVPEAQHMDELLECADSLDLEGPSGDVWLPVPLPAPALIVAGGTGMAQAMSFIDMFAAADAGRAAFGRSRPALTLLWCADRADDFYLRDELDRLNAQWLDTVLVADADRSPQNRGLRWLEQHGARFAGGNPASPVVLCGSPAFVYAAYDVLLAAGLGAAQMQSDVFSYAPRT